MEVEVEVEVEVEAQPMELDKQALVVQLMAQEEALQEVAVVALLAEVAEEEALQEVAVELQELDLECQHK